MWLTQPGPHCWRPCTRAIVCGVAGEHGKAQVWSERLGDRARGGPALGLGWRGQERVQLAAGDRPEVVVLDQQHAGVLVEHRAQLPRAVGVERGSGGVLTARCDDDGDGAARQRGAQIGGEHPAIVERDRLEREAAGPQQVIQRRIAGVLDGDAIARAQVGLQDALDRVHRAAGDTQVLAGDAVRGQLLARELDQLRQRLWIAVHACGQLQPPRASARSGSSAGSGLPRERSRAPGGTGSSARGDPIGGC